MEPLLRVAANRRYIELQVHAPVTRQLMVAHLIHASRLGSEHGLKAFLVDVRGFPSQINTAGAIKAVEDLTKHELFAGSHLAFITSADDESYDFLETVAQNRSLNLRCFKEKTEGLDWLLS